MGIMMFFSQDAGKNGGTGVRLSEECVAFRSPMCEYAYECAMNVLIICVSNSQILPELPLCTKPWLGPENTPER